MFGVAFIPVLMEIVFNQSGIVAFSEAEFIRKIATILISLVPQGLVLFASVTFALGVYRISKIGAIVQRLNAIESFSNVQIVCMDKTGTLTENKLKVHKIINLTVSDSDSYIEQLLGTYSKFSTEKNATIRALDIFDNIDGTVYLDEMPFDSATKMSVIKMKNNNKEEYFVLGAYDILIEQVRDNIKDKITNKFKNNNIGFYRNLLFGKIKNINSIDGIREKQSSIKIEPICIVSISDTVRSDVFEAIELFNANGINFKILSGDSTEAIWAVVKSIGWEISDSEVISGNELDLVRDENLDTIVNKNSIFGRLKPEHKLRIIKSLRRQKIYTAMIGDGVNDLPAIKESDMGIAMEEGSTITKEVADIVLLKNKFSLLPQIFDEGNKIVNTVNSVAKLFLTKNFMVIYLSLISLIFLFDFPLTPRRVALLNIFAIGLPALILALRNKNTSKCKDFTKDIFSYISISAAVIIIGGYIGFYLTKKIFQTTEVDLEMIMVTIMIFISVANFITVAISTVESTKFYFIYGLLLVTLYMFFAFIQIDFFIFNIIKVFYEIHYVSTEYWLIIFIISIISSYTLYFLQKLRANIFLKD
jgi:cation-transporting ATPase E